MVWAQVHMKDTGTSAPREAHIRISSKAIYIDVTGLHYMNRRFVDLPDFHSNDEGNDGTRHAILALIKVEMQKPNTVVLCMEDSQLEYVNPPLVLAIHQVFGSSLMELTSFLQRFVYAFNMSDRWLQSDDITIESFVNRLFPYMQGAGVLYHADCRGDTL